MRASLLQSMFSYSHTCSLCRPFYRSWARYGKRVTKINIFFKHLIWTFKGALLLSRNCNNYFQGGFPPWLLKDYTANYMPRFRTMKNAGKWPQMLLSFNLICVINCCSILYKDTEAQVITPDSDTEFFEILAEVLQGDTLAPFLFIIALDYALR